MNKPKEKALSICQKIGRATMFAEDCNNGYTLPLSVAKFIANIMVDEMLKELNTVIYINEGKLELVKYWSDVKIEIEKL